jgi:hypothetical protein
LEVVEVVAHILLALAVLVVLVVVEEVHNPTCMQVMLHNLLVAEAVVVVI